jgi:hypothetical protein
MKIYLSSTFRDLREYRSAVDRTLRRMGHDVIGMEQYVAEGTQPLERCLADVKAADAYLLILGWRYGYVIAGHAESVTELEFKAAREHGTPILAFLLDPDAPWAPSQIDAMSNDSVAGANIARFRNEVGASYLAGIFRTPEDLASQAAAAVARHRLGQSMAERLLDQDSVNATDMNHFGEGGAEINPSSMGNITEMVSRSGHVRALVVDLGDAGDAWWSTRLYLLASLLRALTSVRQIIFKARGGFGGMASPAALLDGMAGCFPELARFRQRLSESPASADTQREIARQTSVWNEVFGGAGGIQEWNVKVGVRAELLGEWLGERLVSRCIRIDDSGPTIVQVQQIVDSLLVDLPVERRTRDGNDVRVELRVVCRDTFALALAREWVRASMPRMRSD